MRPVLFKLMIVQEMVEVSSYVFFMAAAVAFALFAAAIAIKRYKLLIRKSITAVILMMICGFLGARVLYTILYLPGSIKPVEKIITLSFSNFTLHGGFGLGLVAGWFFYRKDKKSFLTLLDILSPIAGVSAAIFRVGCYMNGCCFGKVTHMPWGVKYPLFSSVHMAQYNSGMLSPLGGPMPVHPTQLYEIFAALLASTIAFFLLKKHNAPGYAGAIFGLAYTIGRFIIFFFREFPKATALSNFIRGPVTYGIAIVIFIIILGKISSSPAARNGCL